MLNHSVFLFIVLKHDFLYFVLIESPMISMCQLVFSVGLDYPKQDSFKRTKYIFYNDESIDNVHASNDWSQQL